MRPARQVGCRAPRSSRMAKHRPRTTTKSGLLRAGTSNTAIHAVGPLFQHCASDSACPLQSALRPCSLLDLWRGVTEMADDYKPYGQCPHCGRNDGAVRIIYLIMYRCDTHKVFWHHAHLWNFPDIQSEDDAMASVEKIRGYENVVVEGAITAPTHGLMAIEGGKDVP